MTDYKRYAEEDSFRTEKVLEVLASDRTCQPMNEFSVTASPAPADVSVRLPLRNPVSSLLLEEALSFLFRRASGTKRKTAKVSGKTVAVKERVFHAGRIERLEAHGTSYVSLHSGGRTILRVPMSDEGCDELVKWAEYYSIPVVKTGDDNISRTERILFAAAGIAAFAVIAAIIIYFSFR